MCDSSTSYSSVSEVRLSFTQLDKRLRLEGRRGGKMNGQQQGGETLIRPMRMKTAATDEALRYIFQCKELFALLKDRCNGVIFATSLLSFWCA